MAIPVILFSLEMVLASWKSITHCLSHVFSLELLAWQPFILPISAALVTSIPQHLTWAPQGPQQATLRCMLCPEWPPHHTQEEGAAVSGAGP